MNTTETSTLSQPLTSFDGLNEMLDKAHQASLIRCEVLGTLSARTWLTNIEIKTVLFYLENEHVDLAITELKKILSHTQDAVDTVNEKYSKISNEPLIRL